MLFGKFGFLPNNSFSVLFVVCVTSRITELSLQISDGCKSPLLKQVVSFRRQMFMILNNGDGELALTPKFEVDGFHYTFFDTLDKMMKCLGFGSMGHLMWRG